MKTRITLPSLLAASLALAMPCAGQGYGQYGSPSSYPPPSAGAPNFYSTQPGTMSAPPQIHQDWSAPRMVSGHGQQPANGNGGAVTPLPPTQPPTNGQTAPLPPQTDRPSDQPQQWGGSYKQAMSAPWDSVSCGPQGDPCACPVPCPTCPKWFGGVYALMMDLDNGDQHYFGYDIDDPGTLYLGTDCGCLDMQTSGGVEARFGKTFCDCRFGIEFVYWGVYPGDQGRTVRATDEGVNGFGTVIDYRDAYLDFGTGGATFSDTIDNQFNVQFPIQAMALYRNWTFQNVEINLLSGPLTSQPVFGACGGSCKPPRFFGGWILGFRYFNFDEDLFFIAENDDGIIDYNSPDFEFQHDVSVSNDLYGVQLGFHFDYFLSKCLNLSTTSTFGVYSNNATVRQGIYNVNGPAYTDPSDPSDLGFDNSTNDVAFLGELRAGLGYKIGCNWRVTGGYRVVAASGIARALNQLPEGRVLSDYNYVAQIDRDSLMILHGAYAGLEFAW